MTKVKTFTNELKIFHARNQFKELDAIVNKYIQENKIEKVISVSDTCTESDGNTVGIIRVLTYEV
jgi:hypothetical protein